MGNCLWRCLGDDDSDSDTPEEHYPQQSYGGLEDGGYSSRPDPITVTVVGFTALTRDLAEFETTYEVPKALSYYVSASEATLRIWYKKLFAAWKQAYPAPASAKEVVALLIQTLQGCSDIQGLLRFYELPWPIVPAVQSVHVPASKPETRKLAAHVPAGETRTLEAHVPSSETRKPEAHVSANETRKLEAHVPVVKLETKKPEVHVPAGEARKSETHVPVGKKKKKKKKKKPEAQAPVGMRKKKPETHVQAGKPETRKSEAYAPAGKQKKKPEAHAPIGKLKKKPQVHVPARELKKKKPQAHAPADKPKASGTWLMTPKAAAKLQYKFRTLPVTWNKDDGDGDGFTVFVNVHTDARETGLLPKSIQDAALLRRKAWDQKNFKRARPLQKQIEAAQYKSFQGKNGGAWCLARKYRIRLRGVDAPEIEQPYGKEARDLLRGLVKGQQLVIHVYDTDQYERIVGDIYCNGILIQEVLLKKGSVWHYKQFDKRKNFAKLEMVAKESRLGLWADPNPEEPWGYRKRCKNKGSFQGRGA